MCIDSAVVPGPVDVALADEDQPPQPRSNTVAVRLRIAELLLTKVAGVICEVRKRQSSIVSPRQGSSIRNRPPRPPQYAVNMSKMIQLRNVPDALHRGLKARAAMAGMSLSDYLLAEIKEIAERPTLAELRERLHKRKPVSAQIDTADLVREELQAR